MPRTAPNVVVKASQLSSADRCRGSSSSWNTERTSLPSDDVMAIEEPYPRRVSAPPDRLGPGGLGDQALVRAGRGDVRADPVTGQATVIVAATGGDQAEVAGETEQAGLLGLRLVGVEDLDPGQAGRGQVGDLLIGDEQIAIRAGVCDDGNAAGRADQADRAGGFERVPVDVGAATVGDPLPGERLIG